MLSLKLPIYNEHVPVLGRGWIRRIPALRSSSAPPYGRGFFVGDHLTS